VYNGREYEEEDVNNYWMTVRKREDAVCVISLKIIVQAQ
jgi:hypothetical protein